MGTESSPEFLADDSVIGPSVGQDRPDRLFGFAVGGRHRRCVGLVINMQVLAEIAGNDRAACIGQPVREGDQIG